MFRSTGICHQRSKIKFADITDGTSSTYLLGEKYLNPNDYTTGIDFGVDHSLFVGNETDVHRWTDKAPMQDRRGIAEVTRYGSAHSGGFSVGLCDGSIRFVSYSIDPRTHRYFGNRSDGEVVENFE